MRRNVQLPRRIDPRQLARLLAKVEVDRKSGCWLVSGMRGRNKRRNLKVGGECVRAHRYVYECLVGPIPAGLVIDHLCGEPSCVNPLHMEPVTQAMNLERGTSYRARRMQTHCKRGHPLSGQNLMLSYDRKGNASRVCRTCHAMYRRAWYERKRRLPKAKDGNLIGGIDRYEPVG
jgi:hypothetical protein